MSKPCVPASVSAAIDAIGKIARRDPGGRGLAATAPVFPLQEAALELFQGHRIIFITGFCVRAAMIGENDGPPGTLALAAVLSRLGKEVALVTDMYSAGLLSIASAVHHVSFPITVLSPLQSEADAQLLQLAASFSPSHVVAIERPGCAPDGHRYSMRAEVLDDLAPAADILLQPPFPRAWKTIAVGDGGNELGMGSLRESLKQHVMHGEQIFCATPADFALAVGISNWGGYALAAALSLIAGQSLLPSPEQEREVLEALLTAGAVDGNTKTPTLSVDGLPWEEYSVTLKDIYAEARKIIPS